MVIASVIFRALVTRVGAPRLRVVGMALAVTGGFGLVAVALAGAKALACPWVCFSFITAGMGLTIPAAQVLAQEAGRRSGGTAAALVGGLMFLAGSLVTPLTGIVGYTTLLPMALLMAGFLSAAAVLLAAPRRAARRALARRRAAAGS